MTTVDDPNVTPAWIQNSMLAWATGQTGETLAHAWARIFEGAPLPTLATATESWDGGDAVYYFFPDTQVRIAFKDNREGISVVNTDEF